MFAPENDGSGVIARRTAIAEIDRAVAGRLGPTRVTGNTQPAAFNRQVAMYLAKRVGGWSVTRIGKFYNGRHHTTVCYAIRRIEALRATHAELDSLLKALVEEIKSGPASDSHERIHLLAQSAAVHLVRPMDMEEFVDALADRLISRLRSSIAEIVYGQSKAAAKVAAGQKASQERVPSCR
jgi:hypothetical protein